MGFTPLRRNASFVQKLVKNNEKMKVVFAEPAYLQRVVTFVSLSRQINVNFRYAARVFSLHFCGVSETRIIHCKN